MRLRSSLFWTSVVTAAPLGLAFTFATAFVSFRESDNFEQTALLRNRAVLAAVDTELKGSIATLRALSTVDSLRRGDLQAFHADARKALATQPQWRNIVLFTPAGHAIVDARLPWDAARQRLPVDTRSFQRAITQRQPVVGDLVLSPLLDNEPGIPVRLPLLNGNEVTGVLTAIVAPALFQDVLRAQKLPAQWISGLVGTDGRLVARIPEVPAGTPASPAYRQHIERADEGWYRGTTLDGFDTFTAFTRSSFSGWTIGFAIPADVVIGGRDRAAWLFLGGTAVWLALAWLMSLVLERFIGRPIAALASSAPRIGSGTAERPVSSRIEEVQRLAEALSFADRTLVERDRKLTEQHDVLHAQAAALQTADTNRTRLLALIGHELRNPLSAIKTALILADSRAAAPAVRDRAMQIMQRNVALLERLVDDLNDSGRVGRGELELRSGRVELDAVLRSSIDAMRHQFEERRQTLHVHLGADGLVIDGDAERLQQVFVNLLSNAHRYGRADGEVHVRSQLMADHVVVEVQDDGVGFSATDSQRLFDMFARLGDAASRPAASLGIGLSLCRAIVELHGGHISAASDGPQQGSIFTVTLPLRQPGSSGSAPRR